MMQSIKKKTHTHTQNALPIEPNINHHARDIKAPITPAIREVGSPNTADITVCTANPAISQHFKTLPALLLWWWVTRVFLRLGIRVSNDLLPFPRPTYMSCQLSNSISITHATCKLYFLHLDL